MCVCVCVCRFLAFALGETGVFFFTSPGSGLNPGSETGWLVGWLVGWVGWLAGWLVVGQLGMLAMRPPTPSLCRAGTSKSRG